MQALAPQPVPSSILRSFHRPRLSLLWSLPSSWPTRMRAADMVGMTQISCPPNVLAPQTSRVSNGHRTVVRVQRAGWREGKPHQYQWGGGSIEQRGESATEIWERSLHFRRQTVTVHCPQSTVHCPHTRSPHSPQSPRLMHEYPPQTMAVVRSFIWKGQGGPTDTAADCETWRWMSQTGPTISH